MAWGKRDNRAGVEEGSRELVQILAGSCRSLHFEKNSESTSGGVPGSDSRSPVRAGMPETSELAQRGTWRNKINATGTRELAL